jgi:hypothetical protein
MIWLLAHPHPLSSQKVLHPSQSSCRSLVELTDGIWGCEGVGEEPTVTKQVLQCAKSKLAVETKPKNGECRHEDLEITKGFIS